jgi:hypothetical protein
MVRGRRRSGRLELSDPNGSTFRHVFCAVVHENVDCVVDLVRNLRFFEPGSPIVLYDGSGGKILRHAAVLERLGAVMYPAPRRMTWGRLHDYVFDCLEYTLDSYSFDAVTFLDSDQLLIRRDYTRAVQAALERQPQAGLLATPNPSIGDEWGTRLEPNELALWEPFLDRFSSGPEQRFPRRWIFWPGTVITRGAAAAIREQRGDELLVDILERTKACSEEIAFSTLAALLGYEVVAKPWNDEWVRWRRPLSISQVADALANAECFWLHPVKRISDDPVRLYVRRASNDYHGYTLAPVRKLTLRMSRRAAAASAARWKRRATDGLIRRLAKQ